MVAENSRFSFIKTQNKLYVIFVVVSGAVECDTKLCSSYRMIVPYRLTVFYKKLTFEVDFVNVSMEYVMF